MALDIGAINQTLDQATSTLKSLMNSFEQNPPSTGGQFSSLQNSASTVGFGAINASNDFLANNIISSILNPLENEFNSIKSGLENLGSGITSVITDAFNGVNTVFTDLKSSIQTTIGNLASAVNNGWNTIVNDMTNGFQNVINFTAQSLTSIGNGIATGINDAVTAVSGEVEKVAGLVASGLQIAAKAIETEGSAVLGAVESIPKAVAGLATDIINGLGKILLTSAEDVWKSAITQDIITGLEVGARDLGSWMKGFIGGAITEFLPIIDEPPDSTFGSDIERIGAGAALEQLIGSMEEASPQVAFILSSLLNKFIEAMNLGNFRDLEHIGNWQYPNVTLDIGNLIEGRYRGTVDDNTFYDELRKEGISKQNADIIYGNGSSLMQINELVAAYYRGIIKSIDEVYIQAAQVHVGKGYVDRVVSLFEQLMPPNTSIELWRRSILPNGFSDYFDDLRKAGWTQDRINALKDISYVVQSPSTIKQFIIHQADNDALAEKFGLDDGINQEYYDNAHKLGITDIDAKRIYRTEWSFPPFFILNNLYKSGEISKDDFMSIMRFTGIPEYFINMFSTSLAPKLTTGDIKDMYKYQLITKDQIPVKLASIGITGDLAKEYEELWAASVKLASPLDQTATQTKVASIKGLSESIIKENYVDGAINIDQATKYLKELGYSDEEIGLNINLWNIAINKTYVTQSVAAIKEAAKARAITLNDAINDLQKLNLTPNQLETFTLEVQQYMTAKTKTPTLAEVEKWLKEGTLTASEYINALRLLGYADAWIPYFLVQAGFTPDEVTSLGFTFTAFSV